MATKSLVFADGCYDFSIAVGWRPWRNSLLFTRKEPRGLFTKQYFNAGHRAFENYCTSCYDLHLIPKAHNIGTNKIYSFGLIVLMNSANNIFYIPFKQFSSPSCQWTLNKSFKHSRFKQKTFFTSDRNETIHNSYCVHRVPSRCHLWPISFIVSHLCIIIDSCTY